MNHKNVLFGFVVLALSACLGFLYVYNNNSAHKEKETMVWQQAIQQINNLHSIIRDLRTEAKTKTEIFQELSRLKRNAEATSKKFEELKQFVIAEKLSGFLLESVEKMQKYVDGYIQFAAMSITRQSMDSKAAAMTKAIDDLKLTGNFYGAPDQGDVNDALVVVIKLIKKLDNLNKTPKKSNDDLSNPEYSEYYARIRDILRNYQKGRDILSYVLKNYDNGVLSSVDIQNWRQELARRLYLLNELTMIDHMVPPGKASYYHAQLKNILSDAVDVMEQFAEDHNYYTRNLIKEVSNRNTAKLRKIKSYFGVN